MSDKTPKRSADDLNVVLDDLGRSDYLDRFNLSDWKAGLDILLNRAQTRSAAIDAGELEVSSFDETASTFLEIMSDSWDLNTLVKFLAEALFADHFTHQELTPDEFIAFDRRASSELSIAFLNYWLNWRRGEIQEDQEPEVQRISDSIRNLMPEDPAQLLDQNDFMLNLYRLHGEEVFSVDAAAVFLAAYVDVADPLLDELDELDEQEWDQDSDAKLKAYELLYFRTPAEIIAWSNLPKTMISE